jgi:hypothetical protein
MSERGQSCIETNLDLPGRMESSDGRSRGNTGARRLDDDARMGALTSPEFLGAVEGDRS